jgi:CRP-like cAMP-binding protein
VLLPPQRESTVASSGFNNHLLSALSPTDRDRLRPHLELVALPLRQPLEGANEPIKQIYFVEHGIVSVVANAISEQRIEVGIIGPEGMTGLMVVMGNDRSPNDAFVQVPGDAQRIESAELRRAMGNSARLSRLLLHFTQAFLIQTSQTAIANGRNTIVERLARWLLMAQDRVGSTELPMTHDFLSVMLGVRRPGVTLALEDLEGRGLIRNTRGQVVVLDRKGLEKAASGSYGVPESELKRLMGEYRRARADGEAREKIGPKT